MTPIRLLTVPLQLSRVTVSLFHHRMNPAASNASRIGREVRVRLLALSVAILGLVLAPTGFSG